VYFVYFLYWLSKIKMFKPKIWMSKIFVALIIPCTLIGLFHLNKNHLNLKVQVCIWAPIFLCILIMKIMWCVWGCWKMSKWSHCDVWSYFIWFFMILCTHMCCKCHYAHTCVVIFYGMCDKVKWVITSDHMVKCGLKCGLKYMIIWFAEGLNDLHRQVSRVGYTGG
jgi:hypothetical protein